MVKKKKIKENDESEKYKDRCGCGCMAKILELLLIPSGLLWYNNQPIDPDTEYGWWEGIWHGLVSPFNYIHNIWYADEAVLLKAEICTTMYDVWYYVFLISTSFIMIVYLVCILLCFVELLFVIYKKIKNFNKD